jgi:hypothetical protein
MSDCHNHRNRVAVSRRQDASGTLIVDQAVEPADASVNRDGSRSPTASTLRT